MDGSQAPPAPPVAPQHSNLIRTDQVQKLPHLNDQQKQQHTSLVKSFWDALARHDPQSAEYQQAHTRLTGLSQNLMKGMRMFQQSRMQQQQQMQAAAQGQPVQRSQSVNPQTFAQLLPQVQQKVNNMPFLLPPSINQESVQNWLSEAKLRYGIALQKQEMGRARLADIRNQLSQRGQPLSQEEAQELKTKQMAAEKIFREGSDFLGKFKDQQEGFKAQQQRAGLQNTSGPAHPSQASTGSTATAPSTAGDGRPANASGAVHPGQVPTPAPHTINSAVNAARNQTAMSPSTPQPSQTPAGQTPSAPPAQMVPPQQQQQPPQSAPQQQQPPQQAQPTQAQTGQQNSFNQVSNMDGSTPTPASQQQINPQGPPRPLSQQAAMAQSAQSYSNNANGTNTNVNQQQSVSQGVNAAAHAHSAGYIQNRSSDNTSRNITMQIPKNLNVSTPEPVTMAPARPTLSGGPSYGAVGMMGQPAIQKHPGYVLEGEGQRVLSKKMLDILVRQVTGGGEGEGLTPDAEEFVLQMADDFVDDVITAACRLSKLRPSSTLEMRDIQLVLERNYNMRISGFSTDDLRTVKKPQPTQGWTQKMSAIQAAKVTQGKTE